jgi:hypothetical protein
MNRVPLADKMRPQVGHRVELPLHAVARRARARLSVRTESGSTPMQKAADYRRHAAECMRLLRQVDQEDHRQMLEQMARTWLKLAEEREKHIDTKAAE